MEYIANSFFQKEKKRQTPWTVFVKQRQTIGVKYINEASWYIVQTVNDHHFYLHRDGSFHKSMFGNDNEYQYHWTEEQAIACAKNFGYKVIEE